MARTESRRTQQQRSEATTTALVAAARELFALDGYAATSLDAVVTGAGVTKGALYHHFAGKRELFEAVFAAEQERLAAAVVAAYDPTLDAWDAFEAGCRTFLEFSLDPGVQRITMLDAHAALGWEKIRELESGSRTMMARGVEVAIDEGLIAPHSVEALSDMLFGALCESAMVVARAGDQRAALRESVGELQRLLAALRV